MGGGGMNSSSGPPNFLLPFPGSAIEGIEWSKSAFTFQQGQGHPRGYYGDGYSLSSSSHLGDFDSGIYRAPHCVLGSPRV